MFAEADRLVPEICHSLFILYLLPCGQRHEDPLEWIPAAQFWGEHQGDWHGMPVQAVLELLLKSEHHSAHCLQIVRGGCRWEVGNVWGHGEDTCEKPFGICFLAVLGNSLRSFFTSQEHVQRVIHHSCVKITQGLKNAALSNSFAELNIGQFWRLDGGHPWLLKITSRVQESRNLQVQSRGMGALCSPSSQAREVFF